MPQYAKALDLYQGYRFKKDKQTPVGYITRMMIGGTELKADQSCKNPKDPAAELRVVAVLNHFLWETGVTDALYFSGQISAANRRDLSALVMRDLVNVDVAFQFVVFDHDPLERRYFEGCWSNGVDMNGLLEKNGGELNISVAEDASPEVQSPENYSLQVGIKPQPSAQALHISSSARNKIVKAWGLKVE